MARLQAAPALSLSSLPVLPPASLCSDHLQGYCRLGERCPRSHEICQVATTAPAVSNVEARTQNELNALTFEPRRPPGDKSDLDVDGPGYLSHYGPRHDNDHEDISRIKILPTMDEILSPRRPYMPVKDYASHLPNGVPKLVDLHFRHLRYDSTESIIDICYNASQVLATLGDSYRASSYDERMQTPHGNRYSLFRDIGFVGVEFHYRRGLTFRLHFACPESLRGRAMHSSSCLEEGMMAALIGLDSEHHTLSVR